MLTTTNKKKYVVMRLAKLGLRWNQTPLKKGIIATIYICIDVNSTSREYSESEQRANESIKYSTVN